MATKRLLLLGGTGQLGTAVSRLFESQGVVVDSPPRAQFDAAKDPVSSLTHSDRPDFVVNCIAFHKVDRCEEDPLQAFDINARFVGDLSRFARSIGATLIHISTDYVFDGKNQRAYTEQDNPQPVNVYGVSKLAGEQMVMAYAGNFAIARVASLFGPCATVGHTPNFVEKIMAQAQAGKHLRVIDNQIMSPTYTMDAARAFLAILEQREFESGIYHVCNRDSCTWFEFAEKILEMADLSARIEPVSYENFHSSVQRPQYCSLDNSKLARLNPMRPWREALAEYIRNTVWEEEKGLDS